MIMYRKTLIASIFSFLSVIAFAQTEEDAKSTLQQEIARLDSVVFDAFNKRKVDEFAKYFSRDLEFFHDKGGLTGYEHTVKFTQSLKDDGNDLRRELIKESLEVYPIPGYGAMQIGSHRFYQAENNKSNGAIFKFVHIWQKKDDQWKITRVVSYDH